MTASFLITSGGELFADGASNIFGIRRHPNPTICPVAAIELYIAICLELVIDLSKGYLFRPTTPQGDIVDKPLSSSTAQQRLKVNLKELALTRKERSVASALVAPSLFHYPQLNWLTLCPMLDGRTVRLHCIT